MERLVIKTNDENLEVILTYRHDENKKDYIIYTDNSFDKDGKLNIYYSLYKMTNNNIELIKATSLEDEKIGLKLIEETLKHLQ